MRSLPRPGGDGELASTVRVVAVAALVLIGASLLIDGLLGAAPAPGADVVDDFGGSGPLGAEGDLTWVADGWERRDGVAVAVPPEGERAYAIVDLGAPPAVVGATVVDAAPTTALVFRYVDDDNHWTLVPLARFGIWELRTVIDGASSVVARTGLASTAPGTKVEVHQDATSVHVFVDGRQVGSADSDVLATGTGVGFAGVAGASWDRLLLAER